MAIKVKFSFIFAFVLILNFSNAQQKKALSFDDYDHWKSLAKQKISNNGQWISYEINPQKGDGYLYIYNTNSHQLDSIARGKQAIFSPENDFIAFTITPQADTIKALKLKKAKSSKMPKDSLCIWNLRNGQKKTYARVRSFTVPSKQGNWLAVHFHKDTEKKQKRTQR